MSEFTVLLTRLLAEERELLMGFVRDSAPFHTGGTRQAAEAMAMEVAHSEAVEKQRLATELRLLARLNERGANKTGGDTSMVFHGPVGSVQTGAGSTANVSQTFDAQSRSHLTAALEKLLADLNAHDVDLPFNRNEVKELVIDAHAEAKKPEPNMTRLRSIVVSGLLSSTPLKPKMHTRR